MEQSPVLNIVVYLTAGTLEVTNKKEKPHYFLGGHGFSYDLTKEGKKKLAKNVPTSTGYYTGNRQKPNTVVGIQDIISLIVPEAASEMDAILKGLDAIMSLVTAEGSPYRNVYIITPHREIDQLLKLKPIAFNGGVIRLGKTDLTPSEVELAKHCYDRVASLAEDKTVSRKVIIDLPAAAEGGLGMKMATKQLEIAEVESLWSVNPAISLQVVPRKEYEEPETDFNKIVSASRWYFETNDREGFYKLQHGYRVYNFGKVEPDKNYYGKLTPDVTYSKLYTKQPIVLLDKLFELTAKKIKNPDGFLSAGDLTTVTSKDVARMLDSIPGVPIKNNLVCPVSKNNGKPVLIELINPVMMSYRVREHLDSMNVIFEAFQKRDKDNVFGYSTFYDITDLIYKKEENKNGVVKVKLHSDFNAQRPTFKVMVNHPKVSKPIPIILSVGYDLPERNSLNSVSDPDVKVWVVTDTRNDQGLRYSTLVETNDFIYVHTCAAANLRVLTVAELGIKKDKE